MKKIFIGGIHSVQFYYKGLRDGLLPEVQTSEEAIKMIEDENATNEQKTNALHFAEAYKRCKREDGESLEGIREAMAIDQNGRRTDLRAR